MADVTIHTVTPDDWRVHRDLRLEMLLDAPDAFCTQYSDVADLDEAAWRERIAAQRHFQARRGDTAVGSVGMWDDPDTAGDAVTLVALYVRPSARGQHVGELLVQAVLDDATARGRSQVLLEVTSTNSRAVGLYQRMGFSFDGARRPHPRQPGLTELGMRRVLRQEPDVRNETRVPTAGAGVEG